MAMKFETKSAITRFV